MVGLRRFNTKPAKKTFIFVSFGCFQRYQKLTRTRITSISVYPYLIISEYFWSVALIKTRQHIRVSGCPGIILYLTLPLACTSACWVGGPSRSSAILRSVTGARFFTIGYGSLENRGEVPNVDRMVSISLDRSTVSGSVKDLVHRAALEVACPPKTSPPLQLMFPTSEAVGAVQQRALAAQVSEGERIWVPWGEWGWERDDRGGMYVCMYLCMYVCMYV